MLVVLSFFFLCTVVYVGRRGGERRKLVGNISEESQVRGFYNITFIYTNPETV